MRALKDLAKEGKTVIVAIHQPRSSIFAMFSDLILLSERGVVYNGPAESAVQYFEDQGFKCPPNYNPAEFLTDLISVDVSSPEKQQESESVPCPLQTINVLPLSFIHHDAQQLRLIELWDQELRSSQVFTLPLDQPFVPYRLCKCPTLRHHGCPNNGSALWYQTRRHALRSAK